MALCACVKDAIRSILYFLYGCLRCVVFTLALTALVSTAWSSLAWADDLYLAVFETSFDANALIKIWNGLFEAFQGIICILVMADAIVSTDAPFGNVMDKYSFLYLFKMPPLLTRALLWLLVTGISSSTVFLFFQIAYSSNLSAQIIIVLDLLRKILIVPSMVCIVVISLRCCTQLFNRKSRTDGDRNHWTLTRYYERLGYTTTRQRPKQRVERMLMLVVVLFVAIVHILYLLVRTRDLTGLSVPEFLGNYSTISPYTKLLNTSHTNINNVYNFGTIFQVNISVDWCSSGNALSCISRYFDRFGTLSIHIFLSIYLILYLCIHLCKSTFVPVHTAMKVLLFYNLLSAVPSRTEIKSLVKVTTGQTLSTEAVLWVLACFPLLILLPAVPYIFTRSPYKMLLEIKGLIGSILSLIFNMSHPAKLYRFSYTLAMLFGISSAVLILLALPLPWLTVEIHPDKKLESISELHDQLLSSISTNRAVLTGTIEVCTNGSSTKDAFSAIENIKTEQKDCYHPNRSQKIHYCNDLVNALNMGSKALKEVPLDWDSIDIFCPIFLPLIIAANALIVVPFGGPAGKALMTSARMMQMVRKLMDTLKDIGKVFGKFESFLRALKVFLKRPIAWETIWFTHDMHMLYITLPCILVGIVCVSVGFWRRKVISGFRQRLTLTLILAVLAVANTIMLAFVLFCKSFLLDIFEYVPLISAKVTENLGWKLLKLACVFSSVAVTLMFLYSIAGNWVAGKLARRKPKSAIEETELNEHDSKTNTDKTDSGKGHADGSKSSKKTSLTGIASAVSSVKISPRTWFMPLFPAIFAGITLIIMLCNSFVAFTLNIRLTGKISEVLTNVHEGTILSKKAFETIKAEESLCDVIAEMVTAPFKAKFMAATTEILDLILGFDIKLFETFTLPHTLEVTGWNILFAVPPTIGVLLFFAGFAISLMPSCICGAIKVRLLRTVRFLICVVIAWSINMSFMATKVLSSAMNKVPMLEITVVDGPAINYCMTSTLLLLVGFIELIISERGPLY